MAETEQPKGKLTLQTEAMPADTNVNGDIFGGWLVSRMDMACGIAARRRAKSRAVTISIEQLLFIKPVVVGDTVSVYVDLVKVGRTSMRFEVEVWAISLFKTEPQKVGQGTFTFVAINEERKPHPVDRD